jgi:acetyl/propionyl-CoA carboxylase alpha subunit/acetyl-CoA carboxylase carboxyltransferase component
LISFIGIMGKIHDRTQPMKKLLIANRGEIAIRISRAATELGIETVSIYTQDDSASLHTKKTDTSACLKGTGAAGYLDIDNIVELAIQHHCDGVHPGYGFLSENNAFAAACEAAGIIFVGPTPEQLSLFGDKSQARKLAASSDVPLVPGTNGDTGLTDIKAFVQQLAKGQTAIIKAISGGGGRGMRMVATVDDVDKVFDRCKSEAKAAFGDDAVYIEQLIPRARHIEIQIIGDGENVTHLWDRECSIQRNHQKVIEIAPSPSLTLAEKQPLIDAALRMASSAQYRSLGTFEFLVDADDHQNFYFIEANPRLQVEHTVTEEVTGCDLVQSQLLLAMGQPLASLALSRDEPNGFAIQCRINMEVLGNKGRFKPSGGTISVIEPPSGPGIRTDHFGYAGYKTSTRFDSMLGKLIVHSPKDFSEAIRKTYRALSEFRLEGFETNISFLQAVLNNTDFRNNAVYTRFIDDNLEVLGQSASHPAFYFEHNASETIDSTDEPTDEPTTQSGLAGSKMNSNDPLAVLSHGKSSATQTVTSQTSHNVDRTEPTDGTQTIRSPLQGTIIEVSIANDTAVIQGQQLAIMEAMKMEHVIQAPLNGTVKVISISAGDTIVEDFCMFIIDPSDDQSTTETKEIAVDLNHIRPDLQEALDRHALGQDASRPEAVAKRRKTKHRTARENLEDLIDADSFVEYGGLAIAAQRRRRSVDDLMQNTAADGMVTGIGSVNKAMFPDQETQCIVMSYDYMVLAGTQGLQNHRKKDRMFELAETLKTPVILFAEGGGGRPGDTDGAGIAGLDCLAFELWGRLSGLVPRIGITTGRCFAGNAALLGASDVVIATKDANIGMGGPAMIEGGGLGIFTPDEVGPMSDQVPNGVVDIAVEDEAEAVSAAKKYLSYFQGRTENWQSQDQRNLRDIVPENRLRIYDIRRVIETLADDDSVLELRKDFGLGMITAFARIEGRPVGIVANNPAFLSGAIDSNGADKAARFIQLCDAFDIPILSLCDTPGIMVGPEIEKTALVRHAARMFVTGANVSVPFLTIVLRKGYGLGAQAMAGGGFKACLFTVTWPTGEFGGMGLEGAVKLGFRKELEAISDPEERQKAYEGRVEGMYQRGKAVNFATAFEIDDVIDPADSRHWILAALKAAPKPAARDGKKRNFVDTW